MADCSVRRHYPHDMRLQTTPPDPSEEPVYSERFHLEGYNLIQQQVNTTTRPVAAEFLAVLGSHADLCVAGGL